MVTEVDQTLGAEHTMQYTHDVSQKCTLETYVMLSTNVTPMYFLNSHHGHYFLLHVYPLSTIVKSQSSENQKCVCVCIKLSKSCPELYSLYSSLEHSFCLLKKYSHLWLMSAALYFTMKNSIIAFLKFENF